MTSLFLLNFTIDFLLLITSNRMCGYPAKWKRSIVGAIMSGLYATVCMVTELYSLSHPLCRIAVLIFVCGIAFDFSFDAVGRYIVYLILTTAMGRIAIGKGSEGVVSVLLSVVALTVVCMFSLRDKVFCRRYIPVEIINGCNSIKMNALYDTGNELRDPISGKSVLIVDSVICNKLIGLSREQLNNPIETLRKAKIPGLRLIPFKTISRNDGILLGLYFPAVRIGNKIGGGIVAFSPEVFSGDGAYQALTGGFA